MRHVRALFPTLALLLCVGCSALGLQSAGSFNDRLAYAVSAETGIIEQTTAALNAGTISSADAQTISTAATNMSQVIASARTVMAAGNVDEANKKLALATSILAELQTYLKR